MPSICVPTVKQIATRNEDRPGSCEVKQNKGTEKTMKRCVMLAMAMTVVANSYGGLFDNVIKNAVGVALPQEREKEQERRRAAIIAEQEERARQEKLRKAEEHKAYMAKLEQDEKERRRKREAEEAERRRAEEEAERRRAAIIAEQEERARQEKLRKAEEHKAYMAKLEQDEKERRRKREAEEAERRRQQEAEEAERQRQREAERARERNEENNKIIANYLTTLRKANYLFASRKDAGSMNESVYESFYLTKQALENIPQFPSQPLTSGHVQLYKNVCSGSSLLWSIGQLADVGQFGSHFKVTRPDGVPNAALQDYDGIAIPVDDVLLYCTVEGVDVVDVEKIANGNFFDVEVFGFRKKFPRKVIVDDILSRMVAKYNNSEVKRKTMVSNTVLLGHPGIIRTTTQIICEFTNDAVIGHIGQESYEYNACSGKIARWFAYCEIASNLPPNHPLKVTCRSQESILAEDIVKGKYKREINAFNTDCIGWDSKRKSKDTTMQQGLKGKRKDSVLGGLSAQNASFAR